MKSNSRLIIDIFSIIICGLILSSCSTFNKLCRQNKDPCPFSDNAVLLELPFEAQKRPNLCGLASVNMLTGYYGLGLNDSQRKVLRAEADKNQGITGATLKTVLEEAGYFVAVFSGSMDHKLTGIFRHLDSRRPLILMLGTENGKSSHYVIMTGYDPESGVIILLDPVKGRMVIPAENFKKKWESLNRFTLLAVPATARHESPEKNNSFND